jgi:uncharacterized damage-inducible protein DinB
MFTTAALRRFHDMAHEGLDKLLAHCQTIPLELWEKPLDGFGFSTLGQQLFHIYLVERYWVTAVQGLTPEEPDWQGIPSLPELQALHDETIQATRSWLAGIDEAKLNTAVELHMWELRHSGVPAEMLLHLLTHAYHHKGQAAAMCRLLGYPAPMSDMIWIGFQLEG